MATDTSRGSRPRRVAVRVLIAALAMAGVTTVTTGQASADSNTDYMCLHYGICTGAATMTGVHYATANCNRVYRDNNVTADFKYLTPARTTATRGSARELGGSGRRTASSPPATTGCST
jgi:hypothetical protein